EALRYLEKIVRMKEVLDEAVAIRERLAVPAPDDPQRQRDLGNSWKWRAEVLWMEDRKDEALTAYQRAFELQEPPTRHRPQKGDWLLGFLQLHLDLAFVLQEAGKSAPARQKCEAVLALVAPLRRLDPENETWHRLEYLAWITRDLPEQATDDEADLVRVRELV